MSPCPGDKQEVVALLRVCAEVFKDQRCRAMAAASPDPPAPADRKRALSVSPTTASGPSKRMMEGPEEDKLSSSEVPRTLEGSPESSPSEEGWKVVESRNQKKAAQATTCSSMDDLRGNETTSPNGKPQRTPLTRYRLESKGEMYSDTHAVQHVMLSRTPRPPRCC